MRVVAEIPHDRYKIQIFNYNAKYMLKIELGQFEQMFKIGETDVFGLEDVKSMITPSLLKNCLERFVSMRTDWEEAFQQKNISDEK
ncbi:MAG: hypothetical protein ACK5B9_12515 [Flavobacteriia bacterium]|jgi:hypothetical protein